MGDYFVSVIYGGQNIGVGSGIHAPLGHAGFISINGATGKASYYEYGRYGQTTGIVRYYNLNNVNLSNIATIYGSLQSNVGFLLEKNHTNQLSFSLYQADSGSDLKLTNFYNQQIGNISGYYGEWDFWNSCLGVMTDAAKRIDVNISFTSANPLAYLIPSAWGPNMLLKNGGIIVDRKGLILDVGGVLENHCFPSSTPILTPSGYVPIESIQVGDTVLAYNPDENIGRGALTPHKVTRLYRNETTEWIKLNWVENGEQQELITTPHHRFLNEFGQFQTIESMVNNDTATIILSSGNAIKASVTHIEYSTETAHLFEQSASMTATAGNLAMQPTFNSWQSYNFEVETVHTYIAGSVRVHNDSQAVIDTAGDIGRLFGNRLGALLTKGESQFVQIASGTLLGMVGQNLARVM
jgi:Pretoxin HINT domain